MQGPLRVWVLVVACAGAGGLLVGTQLDRISPADAGRGRTSSGTPPPTALEPADLPARLESAEVPHPRDVAPIILMTEADILPSDEVWWPHQLLVRAASRDALYGLAEGLQARVVSSAAVDGLGVLLLPDGVDESEAADQLRHHPSVDSVARHAITRGVHRAEWSEQAAAPDARGTQWFVSAVGASRQRATSETWVAVLDTGLAHASGWASTAALGPTEFVAARTLEDTPLVDPWDYLRQSPHPLDEHQQGTHVTSLIASQGALTGLAPGVAILPYKVLDADGQGTELALVDALYWAAWAEADVVHMGLALADGYHPSEVLLEALGYVDAGGAVMVSPAGDEAAVGSRWPAASPAVISVGASCLAEGGLDRAPYSNWGGDIELVAPGGCLDRDVDGDGQPDGILAESFPLNQPDAVGHTWLEGTGPAAALVTAGVAQLLEAGVSPRAVRARLQVGAAPLVSRAEGTGAGTLRLDASAAEGHSPAPYGAEAAHYSVVLTPWRTVTSAGSAPAIRITVVDDAGVPVTGAHVHGHFRGTTASVFSCETDRGFCAVEGLPTTEAAVGWTVTVAGVDTGPVRYAPRRAGLADGTTVDTLDAIARHLAGSLAFDGGMAPIGRHDPGGAHEGLGETAPAYTFVGGGLRTSPFGIIASPPLVELLGVVSEEPLDTGRMTDPADLVTITLPGSTTLFAIRGAGSLPGRVASRTPEEDSCLGMPACPTTVVLDSGLVVGATRGRAVRSARSADAGLLVVRSLVETLAGSD